MTDLAAGLVTCRPRASPPFGLIKIHTPVLLADVTRQGSHNLMMIGAHRRRRLVQDPGKFSTIRDVGLQPFQRASMPRSGYPRCPGAYSPDRAIRLILTRTGRALNPVLHIHQQVGPAREDFGGRLIFAEWIAASLMILWLKIFKFW